MQVQGRSVNDHSVALMVRTQELRAAGWGTPSIRRLLVEEGYPAPAHTTIKRWTDPRYAQRRRVEQRHQAAQRRADNEVQFLLAGRKHTKEFKRAFAVRLRKQGMSGRGVFLAMQVVLEKAPSERTVLAWLREEKENA